MKKIYPEVLVLAFVATGIWLIATDIPWLAGMASVVFALAIGHGCTERKLSLIHI